MAFSVAQQKALAILPKISGFSSMIASSLIVWIVVKDNTRRSSTYHRLVGGSSFIDIFSSFWIALSTWPEPRNSGRIWAVGTTQTCTAQGFFATLSIGSAMYNASLSVYYLLTIVRGWKEDRIYKIELYFHAIPIILALALAIANVALTNYNPSLSWCGITGYPLGCQGSTCIRGEHAAPFAYLFYGLLWFSIVTITLNVVWVFIHVFRIERRSEAYRFRAKRKRTPDGTISCVHSGNVDSDVSTSEKRRQSVHFKRTKQVASQCFLYAVAFYLTWFPVTVSRMILQVSKELRFPNTLVSVITVPLQGLPTVFVYLGPMYRKYKRDSPTGGGICAWCKHIFATAASPSTPDG